MPFGMLRSRPFTLVQRPCVSHFYIDSVAPHVLSLQECRGPDHLVKDVVENIKADGICKHFVKLFQKDGGGVSDICMAARGQSFCSQSVCFMLAGLAAIERGIPEP